MKCTLVNDVGDIVFANRLGKRAFSHQLETADGWLTVTYELKENEEAIEAIPSKICF